MKTIASILLLIAQNESLETVFRALFNPHEFLFLP
jgi:hypothetical protein